MNSAQATEPAYARRRISSTDLSRAERMDLRASDKPRGLRLERAESVWSIVHRAQGGFRRSLVCGIA